MLKKSINLLAILGRIVLVTFSFLLIALVFMALKLKSEPIEIPCENIGTISIINKEEYLDLKVTSTCELQYIEIKVSDEISREKMKVIMLNVSLEIDEFKNVEVLIYNNEETLFGKLIAKGEILITR